VTAPERRAALDALAAEVRACTACRLHAGRTNGPGVNEDRLGRPFVGRAGDLLVRLLVSIGWQRSDVFITNIVKCRPPDNRDPEPDEVAACEPYLRRQLQVLDPALVVTLGRHSMSRFMPGTTISRAHGTTAPVDPATGAATARVFAMYHPAAALRAAAVETASFADAALIPAALMEARRLRDPSTTATLAPTPPDAGPAPADAPPQPSETDQLTLFT
jgi:uracil-DNA glycosylase family 4